MRKYPRLFREREAEKPAPKAAPAKPREYGLRFRLDEMKLEWTFPSPEARYWFNIGFREGVEYQTEALKRRKKLPLSFYAEFSPLKDVKS